MKATEIKYARRINLGNYEHEEVAITAVLDEDDSAVEGIGELKKMVAEAVAAGDTGSLPGVSAKDPKGKTPAVEKKTEKKAGEKKGKAVEEKPDDEVESDDADVSDSQEEETIEEEKEEKKPAAGKKGFKKKASPYSRTNDTHKALFSEKLTELFPKWKGSDAGKAKAKQISKDLDGEEFLDSEGEMLPSFIASLKKGMK